MRQFRGTIRRFAQAILFALTVALSPAAASALLSVFASGAERQ